MTAAARQAELFRTMASPGRSLPVLSIRQRGARFVEQPARSVLNPPESTGMGFWSLNPFVGCEFGCSYCYARFTHRYVSERAAQANASFEHQIYVKSRAHVLAALDRNLPRLLERNREGRQNLVIGTSTDPYQPAERIYRITRAVLGRLMSERGIKIGVITKSPLVTRDLDLLTRLAERHDMTVYVSLISEDPEIIRAYEVRSPMPHARLRALGKLTQAGLRAGLMVAPVLPGITDTATRVSGLIRAAAREGAHFVYPSVLRLYPDALRNFLPIVDREQPELAARYRAAYARGRDAPAAYQEAVRRRFARIAACHGIATTNGNREQPVRRAEPRAPQLALWKTN